MINDEEIFDAPEMIAKGASVPLRSPFRYPGGKTWFVPRLRQWLSSFSQKPSFFIEPFAGGASCGLTVGFEDLAHWVVLVERDPDIAAVWKTIFYGEAQLLANRILEFEFSEHQVEVELNTPPASMLDRAFQTILKNRVNRAGVLAPGAGRIKKGENGKGLSSRWYPETLAKRILAIFAIREKFIFIEGDAFKVLSDFSSHPQAVYFIDPPYTAGGKSVGSRLYNFPNIDHDHLFQLCEHLTGDFLMTYDSISDVKQLAEKYRLVTQEIAMKNSHHTQKKELLISRG